MPSKNPKQAFIFLHSAKSGGSSFWHSLVASAEKNQDIFIGDAYHESLVQFGSLNNQAEAAKNLIESFTNSSKYILLMHRHGYWRGCDLLIPKEMKRTYILLIREANDRLRSSYKWYLQTELKKAFAESESELMNFFDKWKMSWGYNNILPLIFEKNNTTPTLDSIPANQLIPLLLEEYNLGKKSKSLHALAKALKIEIPLPMTLPQTITKNQPIQPSFPVSSHQLFWQRFHKEVEKENKYNLDIIKRCDVMEEN